MESEVLVSASVLVSVSASVLVSVSASVLVSLSASVATDPRRRKDHSRRFLAPGADSIKLLVL